MVEKRYIGCQYINPKNGVLCKQYSKTSVRNAGLSKSKVDVIAYNVGNVEKSTIPGQVITHGDAISFSV